MDNKSKKRNSNNSYIPLNQYSYSQNNRGNLAPGIVQWIQKNRNNIQFDNRNNSEHSKENFAQQAQQNRNNILQAFRNRRNEQRQNNEISRSSLNQFFRNEDRNNNLVNIDNQDLNNYVQNEANRIIQNQRNYYQSDEYRQRLNNAGVSLSNQTRLSNQLNSTNRPNISILSSEQFRDFHPNSSTIGSTHYRRTTGQSGQTYNPGIYFNRDYLRRQHQYDRIPEYIQHETSHWADRLTPDAQRYNESLIEGNLRPEVSEYRSNPREIRARGMVVLQNYLNNRNQYRDLDDYLDNSNDNSDALYDLRNNIFRDEQSMRNYLNHFVSNDITNQNGYQLYYAKKGGFITSTTYGTTYSDRSKLVSKNSVQRFKQGKKILFAQKGTPLKRFVLTSSDNKFRKEFDSEEQAKAFRKTHNIVGVIRDQKNASNGTVVKSNRTSGKDTKTTAYDRQEAEKPYNGLSYKDAYKKAQSTGNQFFAYRGKVYKTDLKNGKDNITDMIKMYGNNLGWDKDPKLQNKPSRAAREQYRKNVNTSEIGHVERVKKTEVPYASSYDGGELFSNVMGLISPTRWVGAIGRASRGEGKGNFVSKVFSNMLDPQNGARENQGIFSSGLSSANEQWAAEHPVISGLTNGVLDAFVYGPKPKFTKEFISKPIHGYTGRVYGPKPQSVEVPVNIYEGELNISPGIALGKKPYVQLSKIIEKTTEKVTPKRPIINSGKSYIKYYKDKPTGNYNFSWSEGMKDMFPGVTAVTANNMIKGSN